MFLSKTPVCLHLQVIPTQLDPIDRVSPHLRDMSKDIMYHRHKLLDLIDMEIYTYSEITEEELV
jgi:hypothetical protein